MEKQFVICKYCKGFSIINVIHYKTHVLKVHREKLANDYDLYSKVLADKDEVHRYREKIKEKHFELLQKQQEKKAEKIKRQEEEANKRAEENRRFWQQAAEEAEVRERERQRLIQKYINDNTHNLRIIWDDIIFAKDLVKFDVKRLNIILRPINVVGVFESLNLIKKEYFQRLYSKKVYKLTFFKGEIVVEESPGWKQILETIEFAKEFYEYKYLNLQVKAKTKRFNNLSNEEILSLFEKSFIKSDYLKFLASKQSENHKIIPIIEFINKHTEESFLFRLLTKRGTTLIIWENVNDARATHIFLTKEDHLKDTLESVEEFICREDIATKRSILYYNNPFAQKIKEDLNYLRCIKHTHLYEYISEIEMLIDNI